MVKIKDLTQKQLLSQIEKYEKIYTQLLAERQKRVEGGIEKALLMTSAEKKAEQIRKKQAAQKANVSNEQDSEENVKEEAYHLKIDESELSTMKASGEGVPEDEEVEEEVRVTQLLQLSKEQLEELRGGPKKEEKTKKKGMFGKKK